MDDFFEGEVYQGPGQYAQKERVDEPSGIIEEAGAAAGKVARGEKVDRRELILTAGGAFLILGSIGAVVYYWDNVVLFGKEVIDSVKKEYSGDREKERNVLKFSGRDLKIYLQNGGESPNFLNIYDPQVIRLAENFGVTWPVPSEDDLSDFKTFFPKTDDPEYFDGQVEAIQEVVAESLGFEINYVKSQWDLISSNPDEMLRFLEESDKVTPEVLEFYKNHANSSFKDRINEMDKTNEVSFVDFVDRVSLEVGFNESEMLGAIETMKNEPGTVSAEELSISVAETLVSAKYADLDPGLKMKTSLGGDIIPGFLMTGMLFAGVIQQKLIRLVGLRQEDINSQKGLFSAMKALERKGKLIIENFSRKR